MPSCRLLAATAGLALALASPALAASMDAKPLGKFGVWEAAWFTDNGNKVCYMAAMPDSTDAKKPLKGRGKPYLFVTHWPADKEKNAVTMMSGFDYKKNSKAVIAVGGKVFNMSTTGKGADTQTAWIDDQSKEDSFVEMIQKSAGLTIKITSKRGNVITDSYSLDGAGDAYKAITRECGY